MRIMRQRIIAFIKKETIFCVSILLAAVSAFFVHPDSGYIAYIDWNTLMLLFSLMAVMAGYQKLGLFRAIGIKLLEYTRTSRQLVLILVFLPFLFSMFITNDVALITFVPFALTVLRIADIEKLIVPTVILQTVAANLGSMLMPMGNPQNLYLYAKSDMTLFAFLKLMLPYTVVSAFALFLAICIMKKENVSKLLLEKEEVKVFPVALYSVLFVLCILAVSSVLKTVIVASVILAVVILYDPSIFKKIDYTLLGTFMGFFVFIGNMGRISAFCVFIESVLIGHETVVAVLASQVISNVPAALLLSGFSDNYSALLTGVNLGGLGTLIASMASLISYKHIAREYSVKRGEYIVKFSVVNIVMLVILVVVNKIIVNLM